MNHSHIFIVNTVDIKIITIFGFNIRVVFFNFYLHQMENPPHLYFSLATTIIIQIADSY